MKQIIRRAILAFALIAGIAPVFAQAPPPVPALPDSERRTSYSISGTTCACNVNFALYGDSTDYSAWVEVYLNGIRVNFNDASFGWTITSPTGALGSIPRPVTDAVLTFNAVQTGTVQIVGARRPRRTATFAENRGVAARDLNQILNDMIAQNRETWDKTNDVTGRALISQPGNTIGLLPLPSACASKFLGFDPTGLIPQCNAGGAGSGNVVGPLTSTDGDFALFDGATGALLKDGPSTVIRNASANTVWSGPASGAAAAPGFRNLVSADMPAGVDANALNTKTANYTIANTDCGKTIQAGTGATGLFTVTLPAVAGFATNCKVTVVNGDTGREKILSGWPSITTSILWPQQLVQVEIVNGVWIASIAPGEWHPTSPVVFNVSTTGTDAAGCALGTGAAACATGQFAMNMMCTSLSAQFLNPNTIPSLTIKYADGAYTSTNTINSFCDIGSMPWVGATQSGWLTISGNTNLTGVTLNCGANTCFAPVHSVAGWWIEGFSTTGTSCSVIGDAGTHLYLGINKYGTTGAGACDVNAAYGSLVEFETSFTSTGSKNRFVTANQSGSRIIFKPVTVTLTTSTFTVMYEPTANATITAQGSNVTYSGVATVGAGNCYQPSVGGGLQTDGGLAALVTACGGSAGTVTNPGWAN